MVTEYTTLRVRTDDLRYALKALNIPNGDVRKALKMLVGFATTLELEFVQDDPDAA